MKYKYNILAIHPCLFFTHQFKIFDKKAEGKKAKSKKRHFMKYKIYCIYII